MLDYRFKLTPGFGRRVGFLAGRVLLLILLPSLVLSTNRGGVVNSDEILFRKHAIDLGSLSESCAVVDVNRDGRLDIVSSENWYEQGTALAGAKGVHWAKHRFRKVGYNSFYIENLIDIGVDVDGDGLTDIVSSSYWSRPFTWWKQPRRENEEWHETVIASHSPVEFVFLVDILGTGKPLQLLPQFGNPKAALAWYELVGKGADAKWVDHEVSPQSYGHGIGAGDINGMAAQISSLPRAGLKRLSIGEMKNGAFTRNSSLAQPGSFLQWTSMATNFRISSPVWAMTTVFSGLNNKRQRMASAVGTSTSSTIAGLRHTL